MDDLGNPRERIQRFGDLLRRHRLERRISQRELAELAGISLEAVSTLERGFRRVPRGQTLGLLTLALQLTPEEAAEFECAATADPPRPRRRQEKSARGRSRGHVPRAWKPFLGRENDLREIHSLTSTHRLVAIVGAGGIGKTSIAVAIANELNDFGDDPVYFIELASIGEMGALLTSLANAVNARMTSEDRQLAVLVQSLETRSVVLVLDNCEHIVREVTTVAEALLSDCPGVRIIATSRAALGMDSEAVYQLPTLALPPGDLSAITAAEAAGYDAVNFFVARAMEVTTAFTITDENAPIISQICRRLDGIALGIELAARRTRALTLHDILDRLDRPFRLLTGGSTRVARQETLRTLFDWSYDLLVARDRHFFDALGVFPGSFSLEAAHAVVRISLDEFETLDLLESLVAKSLVVRSDGDAKAARYSLLQTLREYALEHLTQSNRIADLRYRFLDFMHDFFVAAGRAYALDPRDEVLGNVGVESENRFHALAIARQLGEYVRGAELLLALRYPNGREIENARMTAFFARSLGDTPSALVAHLWSDNAYDELFISKESAVAAKRLALGYARASGDHVALVSALHAASRVEMMLEEFDSAARSLEEAATLPMTVLQKNRHAKNTALFATYVGDPDSAATQFHELARLERQRGNLSAEFDALHNAAEAEHAGGYPERALATTRILRTLLEALPTDQHASLLANAAGYSAAIDDTEGAREYARLVLRDDRGCIYTSYALEHMALAEAIDGKLERAATLFGQAYELMSKFFDERHYTEKTTRQRLLTFLQQMDPVARALAEERGARMPTRNLMTYVSSVSVL